MWSVSSGLQRSSNSGSRDDEDNMEISQSLEGLNIAGSFNAGQSADVLGGSAYAHSLGVSADPEQQDVAQVAAEVEQDLANSTDESFVEVLPRSHFSLSPSFSLPLSIAQVSFTLNFAVDQPAEVSTDGMRNQPYHRTSNGERNRLRRLQHNLCCSTCKQWYVCLRKDARTCVVKL